jgi:hypothetical protein
MPGIPTLNPKDFTLDMLRDRWLFMLVRVLAEPLSAALAPPLIAFGPQWDSVDAQSRTLSDAVLQAKANTVTADNGLNTLVLDVSSVIHGGQQPDVTLPVHQLYFGNATPYEFRKPVLGSQLASMNAWPDLLAKATQPELLALAAAGDAAVSAGEAAATALQDAEANLAKFELDGAMKQLFDSYNALAAKTYGALRAIVHDQPALNLPQSWPESFFLHESRAATAKTIEAVKVELEKRKAAVAESEALLLELETKKQAAEAMALEEAKAQEAAALAKAAAAAAKKEAAAAQKKANLAIAAAKRARKKLKG